MPKSKVPKKKLFREFSLQDKKYIRRNYLKKLKVVKHFINKEYDINFSHVEFLFWGYDLQFFTIKYAAESLAMNRNNTQNRFITIFLRTCNYSILLNIAVSCKCYGSNFRSIKL